MSLLNNTLLLGADAGATGYSISRSLRFNSSDSAYLSRTPASAGNRKIFTLSLWAKPSSLSGYNTLFSADGNRFVYRFGSASANNIEIYYFDGSVYQLQLITSAVYRDPSAWYHLQLSCNTDAATASDRVKLYVNGMQVTTFSTASYPSSGLSLPVNNTVAHYLGTNTVAYFSGLLADIHFIDGQALDPTSFGEFDENGIWQPKAYTGSYGTNGFHLDFADNSTAAALGTDVSGNGNTWSVNNLSVQGSRSYISNVTGTFAANRGAIKAFNGATSGTDFYAQPADGTTVTFGSLGITGITKLRMWLGKNSSGDPWGTLSLNGTSVTSFLTANYPSLTATGQWIDLTSQLSGSSLNTITMTSPASNEDVRLAAVEVNDVVLIDQTAPVASAGNDSLVDVPTNGSEVDTGLGNQVRGNYCTYSPIARSGLSNATLANGNLDISGTGSSYTGNLSTIAVSSGKWYYEFTVTNAPNNSTGAGIVSADTIGSANGGNAGFGDCSGGYLRIGTVVYNNGSAISTGLSSIGTGDIVNVAFDLDAGKIWFGKNGTWDSSGNPATGSNAVATFTPAGRYFFIFAQGFYGSGTWSGVLNAGARPFAYTAPSGFKALNTSSLPAPVITKPSEYMDVALWTGNATARSITGLNYSPDLVWIKGRSQASNHFLFDTVRGATNRICSSLTVAEASEPNTLTSFNSDGFSLGTDAGVGACNLSGQTYAAWTWDAGSSTVTNTAGSISSQVRANASAGFSVVTYTGTGANATVGHGLGVAPSFVIVKSRSNTTDWQGYHIALGQNYTIQLQSTSAAINVSNYWNGGVSSSTFGINGSYDGINFSGYNYVAYCFAPVAGYSSFGSYTGNGSTDGPFVYTGFRPRWVMVKLSSSSANWLIWNTAASSYNAANLYLLPNSSLEEQNTGADIDFLSNGFKVRNASTAGNSSSGTILYAAFAESPFQYARAR